MKLDVAMTLKKQKFPKISTREIPKIEKFAKISFRENQYLRKIISAKIIDYKVVCPSGGGIYPQKRPLLAKTVLLSLYLQNRASDFDDFCTDVRDSCPE